MLHRLVRLTFLVINELAESIPGVVVLMFGQVFVKSRVYGFNVGLYMMTDDI